MKRTRADGERKLQKPYKRVAVVGGEFTVARLSDGQPLVHKRGSMADRAANVAPRCIPRDPLQDGGRVGFDSA